MQEPINQIRRVMIVAEASGAILYDRIFDPSFTYIPREKLGSLLQVFHQISRTCNQDQVTLARFSVPGALVGRFVGRGGAPDARYPGTETFLAVATDSGCFCGIYYSGSSVAPDEMRLLARELLQLHLQQFRSSIGTYQLPRQDGRPIAVGNDEMINCLYPMLEDKALELKARSRVGALAN